MTLVLPTPHTPLWQRSNYSDHDMHDTSRSQYRRASAMSSVPDPAPPSRVLSSRSSWCPFSSASSTSRRARPEQLAAVGSVPLNALTLASRQNDVVTSVLCGRLRENDPLISSPVEDDCQHDTFPPYRHSLYSDSASSSSPTSLGFNFTPQRSISTPSVVPSTSSSGSVTNLLLCAPIYESPARTSTSLDLVSQNIGRARLNRLYHSRSSFDSAISAQAEAFHDEPRAEGWNPRPFRDSRDAMTKEERRRSTGWASAKSSVVSSRSEFADFGLSFGDLTINETYDHKQDEKEEEKRKSRLWQSKVLDKMRRGMRRHTVLWRG